ncbi:MAG: energy-coupling factor transporter transmembrane component T [Lachnospiraceae bacterium]|nr:energy-coupling factor transporter transmembrane component T [Lachnospiraceae bacterium]
MIRDITIGQYYPVNSIVHRIDARVKIIGTVLFISSLFIVNNTVGYVFVTLSLLSAIALSSVPVKFMFKGLKAIIFIIAFTALINLFATKGRPLVKVFMFTITYEGVFLAIKMCVRLIMLIVGSSLLTLTSTPMELTDGIESLLSPFKRIGVPSHEIAMMMTIALRFIPTLLDETDKIMKAQLARGADFETGSFLHRAKSLIPIIVPLFISAFRRADELAMALESRCYNGDNGRTRMNERVMDRTSVIAAVVLAIYFLISIASRFIII